MSRTGVIAHGAENHPYTQGVAVPRDSGERLVKLSADLACVRAHGSRLGGADINQHWFPFPIGRVSCGCP